MRLHWPDACLSRITEPGALSYPHHPAVYSPRHHKHSPDHACGSSGEMPNQGFTGSTGLRESLTDYMETYDWIRTCASTASVTTAQEEATPTRMATKTKNGTRQHPLPARELVAVRLEEIHLGGGGPCDGTAGHCLATCCVRLQRTRNSNSNCSPQSPGSIRVPHGLVRESALARKSATSPTAGATSL